MIACTLRSCRGRFAALAVALALALVATTASLAAEVGAVPPRLAGTYTAYIGNYPHLGIYAGRRKLTFGPGSTVVWTIPNEGHVKEGVTVSENRITFLPAGVCLTSGTYVWTVEGKILTLTKVKDLCRKRATGLVRRWTRTG